LKKSDKKFVDPSKRKNNWSWCIGSHETNYKSCVVTLQAGTFAQVFFIRKNNQNYFLYRLK